MKLIKLTTVTLILFMAVIGLSIAFAPKQLGDALISAKRSIGGLETRSITLENGLRYVYTENSNDQAETLVLLHGFGADKDNFTEVAPYLKNHFHLVIPDHIGFGESSNPADIHYGPQEQALRLRELLVSEMGLSQFHMGGNSMGGLIALAYAEMFPDDITSLWLLNPAGLWSSEKSEMTKIIEQTGKNPLTATTKEEFRAVFDFTMSQPPFVPGFVLDEKAKVRIDNYELEQKIFKEFKAFDLESAIQGLTTPSLVVWGEEDRVLHPSGADILKKLMPQTQVISMPGIGHLPMLEAPKTVAKDFRDFASSL